MVHQTSILSHGQPGERCPLSIAQALQQAQLQGLARIDAQLLMLHVLQRPDSQRAWLLAHDDELLTPAQTQHWCELTQRRQAGEPIAYLRGYHDFYGLRLQVDNRVLDPRPDTETLVDWALELIPANAPYQVLDMGTGSGAIALAIANNRPQAHVATTDASPDALAVARSNAQQLGLNVQFYQSQPEQHGGTWWESVPTTHQWDVVVSNPPYIVDHDPHLANLQHEPSMALTSGSDGLNAIRWIVAGAPSHLKTGAWLLLEHGYHQAEQVQALLQAQGFSQVQTRQDLAGVNRCTGGQWLGQHLEQNLV